MWKWVLLGGFVLWYVTQREKQAIPIAGNRAVSGAIDKAGNAVGRILDEAGPALGRWLDGVLNGSKSSSSSSSSGGANTTADFYNWSQDGDYV